MRRWQPGTAGSCPGNRLSREPGHLPARTPVTLRGRTARCPVPAQQGPTGTVLTLAGERLPQAAQMGDSGTSAAPGTWGRGTHPHRICRESASTDISLGVKCNCASCKHPSAKGGTGRGTGRGWAENHPELVCSISSPQVPPQSRQKGHWDLLDPTQSA